jgi:ribosomal protein S11
MHKINLSIFDYNTFFKDVKLKKQYVQNLKSKTSLFTNVSENNYKFFNPGFLSVDKSFKSPNDYLVTHIIDISFARSNSFLHVMDYSGKLKFFYSSGFFKYSGKNKKSRYNVFRDFYRVLVSKLNFLRGKPIALHLKNVGYNKSWIVKKLQKKFFIKCIKSFNFYPYNGCRKSKMRRKKF